MPEALATPQLRFRPLESLPSATLLRRLAGEALLILAGTIFFIGLAATIGLRGKPPSAEATEKELQFSEQPDRSSGIMIELSRGPHCLPRLFEYISQPPTGDGVITPLQAKRIDGQR